MASGRSSSRFSRCIGCYLYCQKNGGQLPTPSPSPTPEIVEQLASDKQPKVNMTFSSDAHYVTVNITNISAASLEYNLIYDATVKGSSLQTGVNASTPA